MPGRVRELFQRFARRGDPAALAEVYDRTSVPLMDLALRLADDPAQAEDVLQSTYPTAIERSGEFDATRPLLPWLTGILTRHARSARRRARRAPDPQRLEAPAPAGPGEAADAGEPVFRAERLRREGGELLVRVCVAAGSYRLEARTNGGLETRGEVRVGAPGAAPTEVVLRLEP